MGGGEETSLPVSKRYSDSSGNIPGWILEARGSLGMGLIKHPLQWKVDGVLPFH